MPILRLDGDPRCGYRRLLTSDMMPRSRQETGNELTPWASSGNDIGFNEIDWSMEYLEKSLVVGCVILERCCCG